MAYDVYVVNTTSQESAEAAALDDILTVWGSPKVFAYDTFFSRQDQYSSIFIMDWYSGSWVTEPLKDNLDLLQYRRLNIYIFVHEPDRVLSQCDMDASGRWIESAECQSLATQVLGHDDVRLLVTAPFVKSRVEELLLARNVTKNAEVFIPVFSLKTGQESPSKQSKRGFVVQGSLDSSRRNYSAVFNTLQQHPRLLEHPRFSMMFVGKADGYPTGVQVATSWGSQVTCYRNLPLQVQLGRFCLHGTPCQL